MFDLRSIHESVRREGAISRRHWLAQAMALASLPVIGRQVEGRTLRTLGFSGEPFGLGVASGDPAPDGFVLWTRLAPQPLVPGGGMPAEKVLVGWELARDEAMTQVVRSGTVAATPQLSHSVHIEVAGLEPDRWYFYRFHAGDATSPVGRARTTPEFTADPQQLRFAFASCQNFEQGLYTAYEHMLKDDLDLVIHLGDYIYEGPGREKLVRKHEGEEIHTLEDYRIRHAQYKTDPHLQAMHASCPWLVTWDDHEVDNNYAGAIQEEKSKDDPALFLERRANAYQAYYENLPLRARSLPRGPEMDLYRTIPYGRLAGFQVLDTRQYRTDQPNGDRRSRLNDAAIDPKNTLLGDRQAGWLKAQLLESPATWNVLAQQVMMAMVGYRPEGSEPEYSMDQWPGYTHERIQLVKFLQDRKVLNPVVLTGDIHSNWVNELRVDDRNTDAPIVAAEFVGTSISSGGNGRAEVPDQQRRLAENPCVKFFNGQRGYVRCTVTPTTWRSDYQIVEEVTQPGAPAVTKASYVVENGVAGVKPA